jgi:[histone H3]-lysine4 N-trimethyltransferase MLL3
MFCTHCGSHYHTSCLSPQIEINALNRIGWQCPECKCCQKCKQTGDENNTFICDTCDKCYHKYCTKRDTSTNRSDSGGWKCEICARVCLNCNMVISKENDGFCSDCTDFKKNMQPEKVGDFLCFKVKKI